MRKSNTKRVDPPQFEFEANGSPIPIKTENSGGSTQTLESQRSRELIDKLREYGLDKYLELPQVAIMGDTSSGKSSVLSALSGITFPSSDKLTTRCPTQLIMTYAEVFSGSVTLRRYELKPNERIVRTKISSLGDITGLIQKLTNQLIAEGQEISDDYIVIKVSGPDLPNLTLIDLPGLVRTVETGESKTMIARIRALVNRYLEQKRTIILAVVPANVDMHNTEILQAAEEVDPTGNRTLGIITKLDLVDEGAEHAVVQLLQNKRKKLRHGYHAVKCRGQKELNEKVSIVDGIKKEEVFFKTSSIWSKIPSTLVGIAQLRVKLVALLENIIVRELPSVIEELDKKKEECEDKLEGLGPAMDTPLSRRAFYLKVSETYYINMEAALNGSYKSKFFQESEEENKNNRLRAIIRKEEELFQGQIQNLLHNVEYIETSYSQIRVGDSVQAKEVNNNNKTTYGAVTFVQSNYIYVLTGDGETQKFDRSTCQFGARALTKIKELIKSNRGDELSVFPSYNVFCSIVQTYIESWEKPTMELFDRYKNTLSKISERAVQFCQCKDKVKRHLQSAISSIMAGLDGHVSAKLQDKLASEQRPYTLNHYLQDNIIKLRNKPLLDAVEALDNPKGTNIPVSTFVALLKSHGIGKSSNEDNIAIETEIAVIAYLKVASKRFIDEIPRLLNDNLLEPFLCAIKEKLNVTDDELARLLAEDRATVRERKELMVEKASLAASKQEISVFLNNSV